MVRIESPVLGTFHFIMRKWDLPFTAGTDCSFGNFNGPKVRLGGSELQLFETPAPKKLTFEQYGMHEAKMYDLSKLTKKQLKKWKKERGLL